MILIKKLYQRFVVRLQIKAIENNFRKSLFRFFMLLFIFIKKKTCIFLNRNRNVETLSFFKKEAKEVWSSIYFSNFLSLKSSKI